MPPRQKSLTRGRWRAVALSLLVHSAIVAAAVFGWFTYRHTPPPAENLAIEATVVEESALKGIAPAPEPAPTPPAPEPEPEPTPPPEEQGPPKPDPAEVEKRLEEERLPGAKGAKEEKGEK